MQKVIFTKYSNDRNERFKIHTDILEDEQGRRYVRKVGMSDLSKRHLETMHEMSGRLQNLCAGTRFEVNQSEYKDGVLELEYVQGETLEDMLDGYLLAQDYDAFRQTVSEYAAEIRKMATASFFPCDEYYRMFGAGAYAAPEQTAMECSNIDMIFPNLVQRNHRWIILDYEWTFAMPVPLEFILFRTAHYYLTPDRAGMIGDIDIYALLGVRAENCAVFQKMEENFQTFVCANNTPLWKFYDIMGKEYFLSVDMAEQKRKNAKTEVVRYHAGAYRCSAVNAVRDASGRVSFDIDMREHCDTIVITPAASPCIVYIDQVTGISEDGREDILYGTNGASSDNRLIYFNSDTPQILIGNIKDELKMIHVAYTIDYVNPLMLEHLEQKNQLFNDMRCENQEKDVQIAKQNDMLREYMEKQSDMMQEREELNRRIEDMENSKSWRVTAPMRSVMAKVGRQK